MCTDGKSIVDNCEVDVLRVSYVGYAIQEIPVALGKQMRIILEEDIEVLDEVVVVGYGTLKRVNLTGAVSSVTADELASKPVMSTAQAIAGLASVYYQFETRTWSPHNRYFLIPQNDINVNKNLKYVAALPVRLIILQARQPCEWDCRTKQMFWLGLEKQLMDI